jgi:hypothetical protein
MCETVTFDKHVLKSPNEITLFSISFLIYMAGLQMGVDEMLIQGAELWSWWSASDDDNRVLKINS